MTKLRPDTAEHILNFANSQLKKDDLYYIIFYLASYNYITSQEYSSKLTYRETLKSLYQHLQSKKKYNDFRKIMTSLTKLPWYAQQFRTIKSWKILSMFSAMLQMELSSLSQETSSRHHHMNIFNSWDNLTAEIEVTSQFCPYSPPHIFYEWQFLRTAICQMETVKREFAGLPIGFDMLYKHQFLGTAQKDDRLANKIGPKRCKALLKELGESKNVLKLLYEKEEKAFYDFSLQRDNLDRALNMSSSPIFPTDYDLRENIQIFYQNIKDKLKNDRVISLSMLTFSYDNGKEYQLISTVIYMQNNNVNFSNHTTEILPEDLQDVTSIVQDISTVNNCKIINHYNKLYKEVLSCGKTKLIWIGVDMLKYFPIQVLPVDSSSSMLWFEAWDTIEFASSLRELFQPEIQVTPNSDLAKKEKIKNLRLFGENKISDVYPGLGKTILDNLCEIDGSPVIEGQPLDLRKFTENPHFELNYLPEVVSYYGHIENGNYLEKPTGFLSDNKMSDFNQLLFWPELCCIKRLELWGCHGATLFTFNSTELPQYENFAKRFLAVGVKQILTTIKKIPDFAAALIWEHIALSEKTFPDRHISLLLKNAILWYRKTMADLSERVKLKFSLWLKDHGTNSSRTIEKQHPYLRTIITEEVNRLRLEFRNSLPKDFEFCNFFENDIDTSILRHGEACYLGRKKKTGHKNEDIDQHSENLVKNIFGLFTSSEVWGAVVIINHAK